MKRLFLVLSCIFALSFVRPTYAAPPPRAQNTYVKATVTQIVEEGVIIRKDYKNAYQDIKAQILDGPQKGQTVALENGGDTSMTADQRVEVGDTIILIRGNALDGSPQYDIYEHYRLPALYAIIAFFFLVTIALAGVKGLGSMVGLFISLAVILWFIIPQILGGHDPLTISIIGSLIILVLTTYLAHGISKQTSVALMSTFISLMLTTWLASWFVTATKLTGLSEDSSLLQFGPAGSINLKGLLLGGIIIGTLGALNDMTTTQSAAVFELSETDPSLSVIRLFWKGFTIGREHIVSLVNTLILAYAGSSLIVFIFIILNPNHVPLWVIINSELTSSEIVRTAAGSVGLMMVMPIVTLFAALVAKRWTKTHSTN